jgi:hypothetical protein
VALCQLAAALESAAGAVIDMVEQLAAALRWMALGERLVSPHRQGNGCFRQEQAAAL